MNKFLTTIFLTLLSASSSAKMQEFCAAPPSTHARILCAKKQHSVKQQVQNEITTTLKQPSRKSVDLPPLNKNNTASSKPTTKPVSKSKPTSQPKSSSSYAEPFTYKPYTPGAFNTPKKEK
jgi:hypothetical protein